MSLTFRGFLIRWNRNIDGSRTDWYQLTVRADFADDQNERIIRQRSRRTAQSTADADARQFSLTAGLSGEHIIIGRRATEELTSSIGSIA